VRDLILLLDEIELWDDSRVVRELCLPNGEELLDCVLVAPAYLTFVENIPESLKDRVYSGWSGFGKNLTTLYHELGSQVY